MVGHFYIQEMMVFLIATHIGLLAVAAIAKAIKDTLSHHFHASSFYKKNVGELTSSFWDPANSWELKYKNYFAGDQRPRFFGSTTFLAWTTDAWHLFDTIYTTCFHLLIALDVCWLMAWPWYAVLCMLGLFKLWSGIWFELFYKKILIRK